jgi:hypothetical protein
MKDQELELMEGIEIEGEPVSVLEVLERERQAHLAGGLMERLIQTKEWVRAKKLAWTMYFTFGIDAYLPESNK